MTGEPTMGERPSRDDRLNDLQVYADGDAETRTVIEKEFDRIYALENRKAKLNSRGLHYGIFVTLAFLSACIWLIYIGHSVEGTILGVFFIGALVAVLASRRTP